MKKYGVLKKLRNIHLKGERFDIDPCQGCTMNEYSEKDNIDDMADVIYKKINDLIYIVIFSIVRYRIVLYLL